MTPPEQMTPERTAPGHAAPIDHEHPPHAGYAARLEKRMPGRGKWRVLSAFAAVAFLVVAVVLGVKAFTGDDTGKSGQLEVSGSDSFKLKYPNRWQPLSGEELEALPGRPLAVLRRKDGEGFVVVRRESRAPGDFKAFSTDLTRALDKRVPDFQRQSARTIRVGAGKAFFYSYIRRRKGTVHTVVIVPAGERSYAINTISPGGAEDVAREVARIILSFDV
jgi:hypothetical protein